MNAGVTTGGWIAAADCAETGGRAAEGAFCSTDGGRVAESGTGDDPTSDARAGAGADADLGVDFLTTDAVFTSASEAVIEAFNRYSTEGVD